MTDSDSSAGSEELDLCPICHSRLVGLFEREDGLFIVSCENDDNCQFTVQTIGGSAKEAVRKWNTRITGVAQSKQVTIEVIASALRIALDSFERDVCIDSLTENEIMHLARVAHVASQPSPTATVETTNFPAGATGVGLGGVSQREQNPSAHNGSSAATEDAPRDWFGDLNNRVAKGLNAPLEPSSSETPAVVWQARPKDGSVDWFQCDYPTEHNNPEHFDYRPLYAGASAFVAALAASEDRLRNVEGLRMGDVAMEFQRFRETLFANSDLAKRPNTEPQAAREATIEECAKHIEHEADLATNSLHCGDNSATIAATHKVSRAYYEAAKSIRALPLSRPNHKSES